MFEVRFSMLPFQELKMNLSLFLTVFSKANDFSGRSVIYLHFSNPIKYCIKDSPKMSKFYVVCIQASFDLSRIVISFTISLNVGYPTGFSPSGSTSLYILNMPSNTLPLRSYIGKILKLWPAMVTFCKQPAFRLFFLPSFLFNCIRRRD